MARVLELFPVQGYDVINAFFLYSFLGWMMECVVIRREKGEWENRGFAHAPFCVIYGVGATLGYIILQPFAENFVSVYAIAAVAATIFEYLTAVLMLRVFGKLWWDYSNKPFNYKGILCLESTLGWGIVGALVVYVLHHAVYLTVLKIPRFIAPSLAFLLVSWYAIDFGLCVRRARRQRGDSQLEVQVAEE